VGRDDYGWLGSVIYDSYFEYDLKVLPGPVCRRLRGQFLPIRWSCQKLASGFDSEESDPTTEMKTWRVVVSMSLVTIA
jgi:hypothetical protein